MGTKLWTVRHAQHGISAYEINPGIMQTDMTMGVQQKYDALIQDDLLLQKRWGTAEDVGKAVSMLAWGELPDADIKGTWETQ
jgi:3-oxoacyl-[acyl-carrier protein] reductase